MAPLAVEMIHGVVIVAEQGKQRLSYIDFKTN